jgi:hypothetical protein
MDPFRFFYSEIPWNSAFVAGGWAAWLHFREHRHYINPWKKEGPLSKRDLDVFYFNGSQGGIMSIWGLLMFPEENPKFEIIKIIESPSVYDRKYGRYNTELDASAQVLLSPVEKRTHQIKIDLIGKHVHCDPMSILDSFDQPCSRIGFSIIDGKKEWILHRSHKRGVQYPYRINGKFCERALKRRQKYIARNYLNLECDCEDISRPTFSSFKKIRVS